MATAVCTKISPLSAGGDDGIALFSWPITTANPAGAPIEWTQWSERCVTATGTWGGATLTWEGSNDGSTWVPLNVAVGTAATATADKALQILETPRFARPNLTVVGVGATVTVILCARRPQQVRV